MRRLIASIASGPKHPGRQVPDRSSRANRRDRTMLRTWDETTGTSARPLRRHPLMKTLSLLLAGLILSSTAQSAPVSILLVGNSYTFGRVDPVMSYNAANVDDLTRPRPDLPDPNFTETAGTRAWEPHPWGGVPGIFKQFTVQAGLDYDVSLSRATRPRCAATSSTRRMPTGTCAATSRSASGTSSSCRSRATPRCRPGEAQMPTSRSSAPTPTRSNASSTSAPRRPTPSARCTPPSTALRPPALQPAVRRRSAQTTCCARFPPTRTRTRCPQCT